MMKRVAVLIWPGIANAYLCLSGKRRRNDRVGDRWYPPQFEHAEHKIEHESHDIRTEPAISFLYDAGNCCAEWDGNCGPIQLWWKAPVGWKPSDDSYREAKEHWYYDSAYGVGHWSQMAVDEADLPRAFNEGNYDRIFSELRSWAEARNDDYSEARAPNSGAIA